MLEWPDPAEALRHAIRIRFYSGEQSELCHALVDVHAAAIVGASTKFACMAQQLGLAREIDHVRTPEIRAEQINRKRQAGVGIHADRCRVDQTVSSGDLRCQISTNYNATRAEAAVQAFGNSGSAPRFCVKH